MIGIDEIRVFVVMVELFLGLFLGGLFPLELMSFDARQFWLCVDSRPSLVVVVVLSLFFVLFFVLFFYCICIFIVVLVFVLLLTTGCR